MALIPPLNRTLSSTIPLARGIADRAARTAGPLVGGVVGRLASRLPGRARTQPSAPETFTPTRHRDEPVSEPSGVPAPSPEGGAPAARTASPKGPSPASVARNAAGPRPTAKRPATPKPRSVPGAKLPVSRPST